MGKTQLKYIFSEYIRQLQYNKMTKIELNASQISLKEWLNTEYSDQVNAKLMLNNLYPIPIELDDGMFYTLNHNMKLVCHGFKRGYALPHPRELTIIADEIGGTRVTLEDANHGWFNYETQGFGSPVVFRAPFCSDLNVKLSSVVDKMLNLKQLELPELVELKTGILDGFDLNHLDLTKCRKIEPYALCQLNIKDELIIDENLISGQRMINVPHKVITPKID